MSRFIIILLTLLFSSNLIFAQRVSTFPVGHEDFFTALTDFYENLERRDERREGRELIESFTPVWGAFSAEEKDIIIANANRMLESRMRPFPHFKTYLNTLTNFQKSGQPASNFSVFHDVLKEVIGQSRGRHYMSFLQFCEQLFLGNTLYLSPTTRWSSDNANYEFKNDDKPYIVFNSLNLTGYANNDSTVIYNTKGIYYPLENLWQGEGGIITWERAGFDRQKVWAELPAYEINLRFSRYEIDSVVFYNKNFFEEPLMGSISERVLANVTPDRATYPRFTSYDLRLRIDNIFEDINYEGGFSMRGSRLIGSGDKDTDAFLTFKREGVDFLVAGAQTYSITTDRISTRDANITIYFEEDSIYHPSVQLRYINATKEVSIIRDREGLSASPFFNSFHELDMYFEALYWNMNEPKLDIRMIKGVSTESTALFESSHFFSEHRFDRIQGIDHINPLTEIRNYSRQIQSRTFYLAEIAGHMRLSHDQTKLVLLSLANQGFLWYDLNYDKITVKDRLIHYINAKARRTDYDVIQFRSVVRDGVNARINLLNFDLNLMGVDRVFLSDSHNVAIFPHEGKIKVQKNRNFAFDGRVNAGLFEYFGKLFYFDYDLFKIEMPVIDSLTFRVLDKTQPRDAYGRYPLVRINSVIEDAGGELLIDEPSNKSAIQPFHQYPIFHSKKDAFVYYDRNFIHDGVYKRDDFYFHLEPFTIDSLNTFSTEGLEFSGYLASSGIFPDIYEPLRVQPDFSLGFVRSTPGAGYPVYTDKGTFYELVNLSNNGLIGQGKLDYLTSVSESDRFYFFPDSMTALTQNFVVNEQETGIEYPDVKGKDVAQFWKPYQDEMIVTKIDNPIDMYNAQSKLHGSLTLTPAELSGEGMMEFNDAEMDSRLYKFSHLTFDADTADFRLKTYDLSELAFTTHNYRSHIDFVERKGEFKSNGGGSKVEFPINRYICFMDEFDWYMDRDEIDLAVDIGEQVHDFDKLSPSDIADIDIAGSEFISIHPQQDSLRFISPRARYNLRKNTIYAQDVRIIRVADAAVFPGDGMVTIYKDAFMETLTDAQILANMATRYHTIHNATVNIKSRTNYEASGQYDYIDETQSKQLIYFDRINVDTTLQTLAFGHISKDIDFTLSPHFDYSGDVSLIASREFLNFDGAARIKSQCDTNKRYWTRFNTDINPVEIYIPLGEEIFDENDIQLFVGLMQSPDTLYPAFLTPKARTNDHEIIGATGYLFFDNDRRQYIVSSKEKIRQFNIPGNYFSYHVDNCYTYAEGKIKLSNSLGQVTFNMYGNVEHNLRTGATDIDGMVLFDFYFHDNAIGMINTNIEKYSDLRPIDITRESYVKALSEIMGIEGADRIISDLSLVGRIRGRFPAELQKAFVLGHVRLRWNENSNSYRSVGPIGIGNMQRNLINSYVDGYIELQQRRAGDRLHVYLELDSDDWFYFGYQNRVMQGFSSHQDFMSVITEERAQNRRLRTERGETPYSYHISSERRVRSFISDFLDEGDDSID